MIPLIFRGCRWLALFPLLLVLSCRTSLDAGPEAGFIETDLLIVGGNESACAAAVQAARLGVKRIVLVNDIDWLGGQFSAEAVGCVDEWTTVNGQRTNFPRSGIFLEVIRRIEERNRRKFGRANPGNAFCGAETIEPAEAARVFEELLAPYGGHGTRQIQILRGWEPAKVSVVGNCVTGVMFEPGVVFTPLQRPSSSETRSGLKAALHVRARLTVDSSDWGDVIRLSGAKYSVGPDLKARFQEPSAPVGPLGEDRNEMNPLSWCVVVREAGRDATVPRPASYDARSFAALDKTPPFVESDMSEGIYAKSGWSVYTHRRLVDRWHNKLPAGAEKVLLNWPAQDYPVYNFPKRVAAALDATAPGASGQNLVDMTPVQRRIVFDDAKQHALGMLYHLQTKVHDRVGDFPQSFRYMELTDEFGTTDRLPPKPYIREGLRIEALYMLREQDIRAESRQPRWARVMVPDAVFGFQFNIDFHPTRRKFLGGGNDGPWQFVHTKNRNWGTDTDRAMFPFRSLVPVERGGLLGCSKNIGVTSVVQSAVRLHGQMMHVGQAAGTAAWLCLRDGIQPRDLARDWRRIRELQVQLVRGAGGPGVLLWPFHDLAPGDAPFEAANMLAVRGIWQADTDSLDFQAAKPVTPEELTATLARAAKSCARPDEFPHARNFQSAQPLTRGEFALRLWAALRIRQEWFPDLADYLKPGHDADGDGVPDLDDPLPFDGNNNGLPDRLEAP